MVMVMDNFFKFENEIKGKFNLEINSKLKCLF